MIYSLGLLFICLMINSTARLFFGFAFAALLVAPIIEESMRFVSIKKGKPTFWLFTTILVIYEFITYIYRVRTAPYDLLVTIIYFRILCSLLHFIFLGVQLYGFRIGKKYKSKIYPLLAVIIAIALHFTWNNNVASIVGYFVK